MVAAIAVFGLSGCASLSGSAKPVTPPKTRVEAASRIPEATALLEFESSTTGARMGLSRRSYRNMVAGIYASAADARYDSYLKRLSLEARGTGFIGTVGILVMNGVAAVSGGEAARALASGSAVVAGTQGALSKDVFYGQTLPAVLATMDGNRSQAITNFNANLLLDADTYTMQQAFANIRDIERQANLDTALKQLVSLATVDAAQKKATMEVAYTAPLLGKILTTRTAGIQDYIDTLVAADPGMLTRIAAALKTSTDTVAANQARIINNWLAQYVTSGSKYDEVTQALKPVTGKETYP